jgi:branched-chain amino acid aminotransferase
MKKFVLINNKLIAHKEAKISINQRACLFGDGLFETCRIANGKIYNFTAHLNRINAGLKALKFSCDITNLEKQSYRLIEKNQIKNGILKIAISRGIGSQGYLPTYESHCLTVIQTSQARKITAKKISLGIGSNKKPPQNSLPISCKTMQALPYILNKIEAQERDLFDCVMLSQKDFISETSSANIFWVKDKQIYTASDKCDILLGTIREKIISNKKFGVKKVEETIAALQKADEIFLTNSTQLVLAVDEIIIGKKVLKLEKVISKKLLEWLKSDIKHCNDRTIKREK